jgi:hypothetical protein
MAPNAMKDMIAKMIAEQAFRPLNRDYNQQGMRWGGYMGNTVGEGSSHGGRSAGGGNYSSSGGVGMGGRGSFF